MAKRTGIDSPPGRNELHPYLVSLRSAGRTARPASVMRSSRKRWATRVRLDADQGLFGRRGVKRPAYVSASIPLLVPSIQPKQSASSTDSSYEIPVLPEVFL